MRFFNFLGNDKEHLGSSLQNKILTLFEMLLPYFSLFLLNFPHDISFCQFFLVEKELFFLRLENVGHASIRPL